MPSIKDLKKRITSVKNTQQTTKAMKMVSAAKLRRSQEAIIGHRPYARGLDTLIRRLLACWTQVGASGASVSPLIQLEKGAPVEGRKKVLLVVVSADRGLCGGFNTNIVKATQRYLLENTSEDTTLAFVGKKAFDFFKTKKVLLGPNFSEVAGKVTVVKARALADQLIMRFESGEFHEVKVLYNEFKNAISQKVVIEEFLPLRASGLHSDQTLEAIDPTVLVKPSQQELLDSLLRKHFSVQSLRILLESQAAEHGARMSAMENATKNAGEMIKKLTLAYNKQRQAGITKELLEIISGSEAQKGA
jgi:F-type H+-transporting ATPase subunit gamma